MTKQRIKIALPQITSRDEAEAVMNEIALAETNKRTLSARLDKAILKLQDEAAPGIALCDESIATKADALRVWAESHPEEFPRGKKSIAFLAGTLGFRTGTPKLALLNRAWTWEKVLNALKLRTEFSIFVRTKEEVDKEKILTAKAMNAGLEIDIVGCKVTQDEAFFIEPNLTQTNPTNN